MLRSSKFHYVITHTLLKQEGCGGGGLLCGLTVARRQQRMGVVRAAVEGCFWGMTKTCQGAYCGCINTIMPVVKGDNIQFKVIGGTDRNLICVTNPAMMSV